MNLRILSCLGWIALLALEMGAVTTAESAAVIRMDGQHLSATVCDATPRELLSELARRAGVRVLVRGELPGAPITVTIDRVELERGMARLLDGASYLLVYEDAPASSGERGTARLAEIHVIAWPGGRPSAATMVATVVAPAPPESTLPVTPEVLQADALAAREPERRAEALHALAYLGLPDRAMPTLEQALADAHESVRAQALELIKDTGDGVPFDALVRMARADRSARLRAAALALLAEREDVRAVGELRLGLGDPALEVRERARALLDDLHLDVASPAAESRAQPHFSAGKPITGRPHTGKRP